MALKDIYKNSIEREFNPVVSVRDNDAETLRIEIEEYIFTDEIINGLYTVLDTICHRKNHYDGIWINGYYGSGKSHFLKYLDFCLSKKFQDKALDRLVKAVEERDPLTNHGSKSNVMPNDMRDLAHWIKSADIQTVLFNVQDYHDPNGKGNEVFSKLFFTLYHLSRGFNPFNITMAQIVEKQLERAGMMQEFKNRILEEVGFDWDTQSQDVILAMPDTVAKIAHELVPALNEDSIRAHIEANDYNLSVASLITELNDYVKNKGENYRLIFFVDEVSQFISKDRRLLLELQSIIETLNQEVGRRIWVACTSQQELKEVISDCGVSNNSEDYGKIMGRFECKAALQSTDSDFITQKRILEKNDYGKIEVGKYWDDAATCEAILMQYQMPNSAYRTFEGREDFINYYPFIPYQLRLIADVFASFEQLGFVVTEVKDNERSILNITHKIGQITAANDLGKFISFDQFFHEMFRTTLTHAGSSALDVAYRVLSTYNGDQDFAKKVIHVMFMICNLNQTIQERIPATLDIFTTLMMRDMNPNKMELQNKILEVIKHLIREDVLRFEDREGVRHYAFFSEEERTVAAAIKATQIDANFIADEYKKTIIWHIMSITDANRSVSYYSNSFNVQMNIYGKDYLANSNIDIRVSFDITNSETNVDMLSVSNASNQLVFFLAPLIRQDHELLENMNYYCKVQRYLLSNTNVTEATDRVQQEFRSRAQLLLQNLIRPRVEQYLNECDIVSGTIVYRDIKTKNNARYKEAMIKHLGNVYSYASLVGTGMPDTQAKLKNRIIRPIQPNEYTVLPMSDAEKIVENYLVPKEGIDLYRVVRDFEKAPYGWRDLCTLDIINELCRRQKRTLSYCNIPNCEAHKFADNCTSTAEQQKFTISAATAIDRRLVGQTISAIRTIFNEPSFNCAPDAIQLIQMIGKDSSSSIINTDLKLARQYSNDSNFRSLPFIGIASEYATALDNLQQIRNHETYLRAIVDGKDEFKRLHDDFCRVKVFIIDHLDKYREVVNFVNANQSNFDELSSDEQKRNVNALKDILTDKEPRRNFTTYVSLKDSLDTAINEDIKAVRQQIEVKYREIFRDLEQLAEDNNVPRNVFDSATKITALTAASTISTLKNNLHTADDYKASQMEKILTYEAPETPVTRIRLKGCTTKLTNDVEIDAYLDILRQQMKDAIAAHGSIIVV